MKFSFLTRVLLYEFLLEAREGFYIYPASVLGKCMAESACPEACAETTPSSREAPDGGSGEAGTPRLGSERRGGRGCVGGRAPCHAVCKRRFVRSQNCSGKEMIRRPFWGPPTVQARRGPSFGSCSLGYLRVLFPLFFCPYSSLKPKMKESVSPAKIYLLVVSFK